MPTRNINDAVANLRTAYSSAVAQWVKQHPSFPQPFLTCVYRSSQEQNLLYDQGRTTRGPRVTNARGGHSKHNTYPSRAIDIAFRSGRAVSWDVIYFREFARIIKGIEPAIRWGGNFRTITDNPHFEV